jgi:hypothetical protein
MTYERILSKSLGERTALPVLRFIHMRIDAIANIHFYETRQGGLKRKVTGKSFRCPCQIDDKIYECILISDAREIGPGKTITCAIVFLYPEVVRPKLKVGLGFLVKSGFTSNFGEGEIIEVIEADRRVN